MAEVDDLRRIQQAHHGQLLAIRSTTAGLVEDAWDAYAGLDDTAAGLFVDAAAEIVDGAKMQTAAIAAGYLEANDAVLGHASRIVPEMPVIRGGRPTVEVYERSIVEARRLVSDGAPVEQAMNAGKVRAASTARTDVVAANREAVGAGRRPWVVGYRRVLTGKSCALCATASTQRYHSADLQPIHPNCDCDVAEIYGDSDPGAVVNQQLLDDLKRDGGSNYWKRNDIIVDEEGVIRRAKIEYPRDPDTGKRLLDARGNPIRNKVAGDPIRPVSKSHGELGEVLTDRRHAFTSADDLADVELPETPPSTATRVEVLDDVPTGPSAPVDEIPAKVVDEAPKSRMKPTDPDSPSVIREANRRNVDPKVVAQERDAKRLEKAQEARRRREYEKSLNADHPDVVAVAERYGVTPDEVMIAREKRLPEVRQWIRDEAAEVQAEQFSRLYQWNETSFRGPGTYKGNLPAEFDWYSGLDAREKARLSRRWFNNSPDAMSVDEFVSAIQSNAPDLAGLDMEDVLEVWLDADRRYEMAGAIRRGKLPSSRAYSGNLDVDDLLPDLASRRISARRILASDDLDAAGHIASADRQYLADEAFELLGDATKAPPGSRPYEMSFQRWEEEVRTLEYGLRNYPSEMPRGSADRLAELVPQWIDEDGLDYEDLYTRIVTTAQTAGEEVPSYARIPWQ